MNKQRYYSKELMERVANKTGIDGGAIRIITNAIFEEIEQQLAANREVDIMNFGKFYLKLYKSTGFDISTKQPIAIKTQKITFVPARRLKDYLNNRKKV